MPKAHDAGDRSPSGKPKEPAFSPETGHFDPNGRWFPGDELGTDLRTRRLLDMIRARRATPSLPPKFFADQIDTQGLNDLLGFESPKVLEQWRSLDEAWQWPAALTPTSAAEAIKRAGA